MTTAERCHLCTAALGASHACPGLCFACCASRRSARVVDEFRAARGDLGAAALVARAAAESFRSMRQQQRNAEAGVESELSFVECLDQMWVVTKEPAEDPQTPSGATRTPAVALGSADALRIAQHGTEHCP